MSTATGGAGGTGIPLTEKGWILRCYLELSLYYGEDRMPRALELLLG